MMVNEFHDQPQAQRTNDHAAKRKNAEGGNSAAEYVRRAMPAPTPAVQMQARGVVMPTAAPFAPGQLFARCDTEGCDNVLTTTVWNTYYVDEHGQSTTCLTTEFDTTTITSQQYHATPTYPVATVYQTMTSTLVSPPQATTGAPSSTPQGSTRIIQVNGQHCDCEKAWSKSILGGVPSGTGEVIAAVVFLLPFILFLLVCLARMMRYAFNRAIFFALLPFTVFLATMVAFLPTRAFAATHHDTGHVLAQHVLFAVAPPILFDVALQVYALLQRRAEPSGWIDATSMFLRLVNMAALVLYGVAAGQLVAFVNAWQSDMATCASGAPSQLASLLIAADFLELFSLVAGLVFLFLARWRLRMTMAVLLIQAHIYLFLFIFFVWHTAHDIGAASAWSGRQDRLCSPLGATSEDGGGQRNSAAWSSVITLFFFHIDWKQVAKMSASGLNSSAAFWLLAVLPLFLASTMLMAINLIVYCEATPEVQPMADSTRYKLCYNENEKKMEFVRIDNPGGPRLPTGEPLYEVVRDDSGEGWEIREARIPTVLPVWENLTMRPWYK